MVGFRAQSLGFSNRGPAATTRFDRFASPFDITALYTRSSTPYTLFVEP